MPTTIYSSGAYTFDVAGETSFDSGTVGSDWGALGIMAKFTNYELDNAWTEAYEIGQRYPQAYYTAGLQTQTNLDFFLCQDQIDWLQLVLARTGTVAPYTYSVGSTVTTGMVRLGTPQGNVYTVQGIGFSSCKITITQAQAVQVSLQGIGTAFSSASGTLAPGSIPADLLTWKDCTVGGAATITPSIVQSCDFTINTGAKLYYALGSPSYQAFLPLQSQIQVNVTAFHNDTSALESIMSQVTSGGQSGGYGTVAVNFGTHTATFSGCYLTKGILGLQPVQEVTDQISFNAIQVSIV
jgi:hypothetical protein